MVNDVLDQIIALLSEPLTTGSVHVHVLQTLGALAPKSVYLPSDSHWWTAADSRT